MPWDLALILLVLGVLVPWRGAERIRRLLTQPWLTAADRLAIYASTSAFQWLLAGVVFWRCRARGLTGVDLGLDAPDPELAAWVALVLSLLLTANQFYSLRRLARLAPDRQGFLGELARKLMPQKLSESPAFVGLSLTAAVCEEFLYRGFALAVLANAAGSLLVGAVASSVFFSLAHLYQGRRGLAGTFLVGLLFAGVRIWTGSLVPSIAAHLVADLVAGFAAPRMLASAAQLESSAAGAGGEQNFK